MASKLISTPRQRERIRQQFVGTGFLVYKSGPKTVCEVEVFVNRKTGQLCYLTNGRALEFDLDVEDE